MKVPLFKFCINNQEKAKKLEMFPSFLLQGTNYNILLLNLKHLHLTYISYN